MTTKEKWYHSKMAMVLALCLGIGSCCYLSTRGVNADKSSPTQVIYEKNARGHPDLPERYVEINGERFYSVIDGKSLDGKFEVERR